MQSACGAFLLDAFPARVIRLSVSRPFVFSACLVCLSWLASPPAAHAQNEGYRSNDFAIDLALGPVFGAGRVVGMGGAYGAIATGLDGSQLNPAGYAERAEQEVDFWEWELTGGIWFGSLFADNDIDNNGRDEGNAGDLAQFSFGGRLQFADFGFGATGLVQGFSLVDEAGTRTNVSFTTFRFGAAYSFLRGSLVTGLASRLVNFDIQQPGAKSQDLVAFTGAGVEVGALYRPAHERYRISTVLRSGFASKPQSEGDIERVNGVRRVNGLALPNAVHVPWEADLGFAYQFGERRSNVPWHNTNSLRHELQQRIWRNTYEPPPTYGGAAYPPLPSDRRRALQTAIANDREAERRHLRAQPRRYWLLSADVLMVGRTERGQGVQAFMLQQPERSGARASFGMRVGVETELLPNRLRARAGSYLEPSRFERRYYRAHGTLGSDVRLFDAWRWSVRFSATIDAAPRYLDWGASIGLWH